MMLSYQNICIKFYHNLILSLSYIIYIRWYLYQLLIQTKKQTNRQKNKQTAKQTNKQTNKLTNLTMKQQLRSRINTRHTLATRVQLNPAITDPTAGA